MSRWLQEEMRKIEDSRQNSGSLLQRITKVMAGKQSLPFASECVKKLQLSAEELAQFDTEMMEEPPVFIKNGKNFDSSIAITEHYLRATFRYRGGDIDYGIFRLSDIAMTSLELSKNPVIFKPTGRIFDVYILDAKGKRMGGVSMESETDYNDFNAALEKYAPNIRLNVPMEEVGKNSRK